MSSPISEPEQLEMDEQHFSVSLDQVNLADQVRRLSQQVADFIALQETSAAKLAEQEILRQQQLASDKREVTDQIAEIKMLLDEFQTVMTSVGVARFRVAAEEALRQGQDHSARIREQTEMLQQVSEQACHRIEEVTQKSEKRLSRVVRSFRLEYFKTLIDEGCDRVENISLAAVKRVSQTVKWFHWERLSISLFTALVVALVMGLFMNDEWPWETHDRVASERDAGRVILNAWPRLSTIEQDDVRRQSSKIG